ncbi:MAG: hypothetical protein IPP91_11220 [Betaproteobacteria bacterium]|nr:hypothetical protein [Betaproteobacteria bacterium]
MLVRLRRPGGLEVTLRVRDEHLQAVLDRAWREFGDPGKVEQIPAPRIEPKPEPIRRRRWA